MNDSPAYWLVAMAWTVYLAATVAFLVRRKRKPDWQRIVDAVDAQTRCEAVAEGAEDRFWDSYNRHLKSIYGSRIERVGAHRWRWRA